MNIIFSFLLFGGLLTGLLCVCAGIFLLDKHYRNDAVKVKIGAFGEIHSRQSGLVLTFFGLFLFAFSSSSYSQTKKVDELHSQLDVFMVATAKNMNREFHEVVDNQKPPIPSDSFKHLSFLISVLQQIDPNNGHAIYFTAEDKLWEGVPLKDVRPYFYKYIEVLNALPETETGGDTGVQIIYERPKGYGRQRSGWIYNLMANDFYSEAVSEANIDTKTLLLEKARDQVALSLKYYPDGFLQTEYPPSINRITPTKLLQQDINHQFEIVKANR